MTTTPNEPVSDSDIQTTGGIVSGGVDDGSPGRDAAGGGNLDPQDETDDSPGRDGAGGGNLDPQDETDADASDA